MKVPEFVKRFLPESVFARNVSVLVGGTALGQGITILASPLLTRIYTPDDFGTLAVFASFLSIAAVIASLRYELAIPLPEDDKTAANVLALSLSIVVGNSLLAGILVWLFGGKVVDVINAPQLRPYLWLLPLGIFGVGTYQVLNYWAIRKKAFNRVAQTKLNRSMAQVATQAGVGLALNGPLGLILGQVVGQAMGSTTLATLAWRNDRQALQMISVQDMRNVAVRYRRFPFLSSGAAWLNALGVQLPVLLLSAFYSTQITGWFLLAQRVLGTPLSLLGNSVGQVYFGESAYLVRQYAQENDGKKLTQLFKKLFKYLLMFGVVIVIPIAVVAPWFFPIVFGSEWHDAGLYLLILAPMLLMQFLCSPFGSILDVLERQDLHLMREGIRIGLTTVGILIATKIGEDPKIAIAFLSASGTLSYGVGMLLAWYALVSYVKKSN